MSGNRWERSWAGLPCALAAAVLMLPGGAWAQHALGDGSALDRNLRQGSGGKNTRVRDLRAEIQFQNAIVTGNAPGGKSFHGDVGYLAADEVRANLGSNDLFSFYRDSSTSVLPSVGIRGTDALRYQYSLATGSAPPPGLTGGFTISRSQAGATGGEVGGLRSTADYLVKRESRQTIIAHRPVGDEGGGFAITASPLLGIREITLSATQVLGAAPEIRATGLEAPPGPAGSPAVPATPQGRTEGWQFTGVEAVPRGVERPGTRPSAMDTSAPTERMDAVSTRAYDQVITRFKDQFGVKPTRAGSGEGTTPPEKPKRDGEPAGESAPAPGLGTPEEWRARLDEMRSALRPESRPAKARKPLAETAKADQSKPMTEDEARAARAQKELEEARRAIQKRTLDEETLKALKRTKPRIDDLVEKPLGAVALAYSEHMAAGQVAMADGRYFDAEESFGRALGVINGDPMAQAGRLNAQVASGLFMSAAVNLRNLLASNPEMTGVRYGPRLLPTPDRWRTLAGQLRARIQAEDPAAADAAGLLLAYLGYQFDDTDAVAEGLAAMASPAGEDEASKNLLDLLRAVWVEQSPEPDPSK